MPPRRRTLFATSPTARPTPCGAGFRTTTTEPLRPVTLKGSEWARWHPHSQEPHPRLISIMFSFALSIARRIEGPTSRPRARPRPAKPSLFPTMHVITKFTRRPESVIRWTMLTSRTSSSVSGRRISTISGSRIGRPVLMASARVVMSPARTMRPSFVFGAHSLRSRSGRAARASRRRPRPPPRRPGIRPPPVSTSPRRIARDVLADVRPADAILRWQDVRAVRHRQARIDEALQRREQATAFRGPLRPQVEDGFRHAFRRCLLPREISREVRGREIPGPRGPTVVLEFHRLRSRKDAVPRGLDRDELNDRLIEGLAHDRARLLASKELRTRAVVRAALPPSAERDAVVRTLTGHFFASFIAPAARICCSR